MESSTHPKRGIARRLLGGAALCIALCMAVSAWPQDRHAPRREPPRTKPPTPAQRAPAKAPLKLDAAKAEQARIAAACVRYRLVGGIDCPTDNGSGAGGVDPLRDVRRLGVQNPAKK